MTNDSSSFWASYMPKGENYLWRADILWLNVVSDGLIAIAYLAIPIALFFVVRKRPNFPYRSVVKIFGVFILACGITHIIAIWTVWHGDYAIQGLSKAFTAVMSLMAASLLIPMLPIISSLKSPEELQSLNWDLQSEIKLQKAHSEKLQRTEEKLRTFLQQSPDGFLIVRATGEIEYSNNMINIMFGYEEGGLTGKCIPILLPERSRHKITPKHNELFDENLARSQMAGAEFIGMRADGSEFPIEIRMSPIHAEDQDGELVLATLRDISDRKTKEEDSRKDLMEQAHLLRLSTVGQMAAGLAHELNQPLTAISNNLHTAMSMHEMNTNADPVLLDIMKENYASAQHAGKIIRSLRQLVRKDTGSRKLCDINELVRTTVQLITPEARAAGVEIKLNLEKNLPQTLIDSVQIQQVLVNLGRNAIEAFSETLSKKRAVTIVTELQGESKILLKVADNGAGFSSEVKHKLFQPHITSKETGMGLGLSICMSIIEANDGALWLDSEDTTKTVFCFTIPIKKVKANEYC